MESGTSDHQDRIKRFPTELYMFPTELQDAPSGTFVLEATKTSSPMRQTNCTRSEKVAPTRSLDSSLSLGSLDSEIKCRDRLV